MDEENSDEVLNHTLVVTQSCYTELESCNLSYVSGVCAYGRRLPRCVRYSATGQVGRWLETQADACSV